MTLPNFLGIGVPRGGTTWLHTLLSSHPDVYMPVRRKEIRFFDRHYANGLDWYASFFCAPQEAARYRAIGEISPQYYACDAGPERIASTLPASKLIVLLRHPVSRAYSQYGFVVQRRNYRGSFEEFLATRPNALAQGYYSRYLKRYLRYFDRSQILVLVFEEVFADPAVARRDIAHFLGIAAERFPVDGSRSKVNASSVPNYQTLTGFVVKMGRRFRRWNLEPVVDLAMRLGVRDVLSKGRALPPLEPELKARYGRRYEAEYAELEACLQVDLSSWRG